MVAVLENIRRWMGSGCWEIERDDELGIGVFGGMEELVEGKLIGLNGCGRELKCGFGWWKMVV